MSTSNIYDKRYSGDYREHLSGFEIARWKALEHFVNSILKPLGVKKVLDYGAGSGLHVGLWEKLFPEAELYFSDISTVAGEKFKAKYPRHAERYFVISGNQTIDSDEFFDMVVSVEVMEHVEDLNDYLMSIHRLLKPGGLFVWTTPCANAFSIEHILSAITGMIVQTEEGYRKWKWEDPTHLRRLKSREIYCLLKNHGFLDIDFRFRAHLFSFASIYSPIRYLKKMANRLMTLDYRLFRCLPNGASMIGVAKKRPDK